jgi:hypothetical protein
MLMHGGEGLDIAERYNAWGVTAFVLTYRLSPRYVDNVRVMQFELRSYARSAAWPSFQGHRMVGFRAVREP